MSAATANSALETALKDLGSAALERPLNVRESYLLESSKT